MRASTLDSWHFPPVTVEGGEATSSLGLEGLVALAGG